MSSMLRKGGKSFKPSARPRPNTTRPAASQPATRPSSDVQLQTPVPAIQPSNPSPPLTENVPEEDQSQSTTPQLIQITPQSHSTPRSPPQPSLPISNNNNFPTIDNTTKRKTREDEAETTTQIEQPPSKARKLTPPSDTVQHSGNNAALEVVLTPPTSQPEVVLASSHAQEPIHSSRIRQEHASDNELLPISSSTTDNSSNGKATTAKSAQPSINATSNPPTETSRISTTIDKAQNNPPSANSTATERNDQAPNLELENNSQNASLSTAATPVESGQGANGTIQTTAVSSEDVDLSGIGAGEASQTPHLVSTATPTSEETSTPVDEDAAPAPKKPRKKPAPRKKKVQVEDGEEPITEIEIQLNRRRRAGGQTRERKKKDGDAAKKRRARSVTPEDAENEVIEPTVMKMADLCKDIRIGKKFSKHDELRLRDKQKKIDAQLAEHPELAGLINNTPTQGNAEPREEPTEVPAVIVNNNGLQMRVIDGQIVLDDRSLQVDRHRQARNQGQVLEEIEENEFTRAVNSSQHMKRTAAMRWDSDANELFYQGLRQFGTAFEMIAAMFPDRNRRQIKLKFVREERQNPDKVDRALKGKTDEIDFEEYTQLSGQKFEDTADIQAEQRRLEDEHNAEEEKVNAAKAAADRKKKEAIFNAARRRKGGASDGEDGPESQKENTGAYLTGMTRKKPAKSKKNNKASMQGGGEEIEIIGTI